MRTNYSDSSARSNGRHQKRQGSGGSNGGRRSSNSGAGRRSPGQNSSNGGGNIAGMTSTRNKYLEMAKESLSNGNRVEAERFYQHAEHYSKMVNAAMDTKRERDEARDLNQRNNSRHNTNNSPASESTCGETPDQPVSSETDAESPATKNPEVLKTPAKSELKTEKPVVNKPKAEKLAAKPMVEKPDNSSNIETSA